jgi:hypothetical protein
MSNNNSSSSTFPNHHLAFPSPDTDINMTTTTTTTTNTNSTTARKRPRGAPLTRAEIAKRSRERKAQQEHEMEMELDRLRERNRQLLIRVTRGLSKRTRDEEQGRLASLAELVAMVNDVEKPNEREIGTKLMQYKEKFSDFGVERGAKVKFHLQQLRDLLLPAEISRLFFSLMDHWTGAEDPVPFEGEQSVGESWRRMAEDLGVTEEQKNQCIALKTQADAQDESMREAFRYIDDLEALWNTKSEAMGSKIIDQITKVITPSQSVRFLNWIEKNKAVCLIVDHEEWREKI